MTIPNSNTRHTDLAGYNQDYGNTEARLALAIADAADVVGGGGGTSSATIASGIDASVDVSAILTELQAINANTDEIEVKLDAGNISIDNVDINTDELESILKGTDAATIVDVSFTATSTAQIASAANPDTLELFVQNKSLNPNEIVYIRNNGTATAALSITLFPGDSHTFAGLEAQQALSVITNGNNINVYVKRTNA